MHAGAAVRCFAGHAAAVCRTRMRAALTACVCAHACRRRRHAVCMHALCCAGGSSAHLGGSRRAQADLACVWWHTCKLPRLPGALSRCCLLFLDRAPAQCPGVSCHPSLSPRLATVGFRDGRAEAVVDVLRCRHPAQAASAWMPMQQRSGDTVYRQRQLTGSDAAGGAVAASRQCPRGGQTARPALPAGRY
jgi:hypothetical protein